MRILVANANTTEAITTLCAEAARAAARPGTEIIPATPRFGPAVISSRAENAIAAHGLLSLLAEHAGIAATPQDALRAPERVEAELAEAIAGLVAQGAEAEVLGGAELAGMAPRLQPRAAVPLLDGIACGVTLLEGLVVLRLPKPSAGSHAPPHGRGGS